MSAFRWRYYFISIKFIESGRVNESLLKTSSIWYLFSLSDTNKIRIESVVICDGKTGVEMEALTGASIAALTIYDMCKAVDREMVINKTQLLFKSGGKSGTFKRND